MSNAAVMCSGRDYLVGQLGGLQACVDDDPIVVLNPLFIEIADT